MRYFLDLLWTSVIIQCNFIYAVSVWPIFSSLQKNRKWTCISIELLDLCSSFKLCFPLSPPCAYWHIEYYLLHFIYMLNRAESGRVWFPICKRGNCKRTIILLQPLPTYIHKLIQHLWRSYRNYDNSSWSIIWNAM